MSPPRHVAMSLISQGAPQWTGAWTYTRELIRELGSRPEQIRLDVLVNEHGWTRLQGWAPNTVRLEQARYYAVGSSTPSRLLGMGATALYPALYERQIDPGATLVHYPLTLNVPPVRRPRVMTLHDIQHHDLPQAFTTAQLRWRDLIYDRAAKRSAFVFTDSDHARERIVDVLGVDPQRIATVHLGVDLERFTPDPRPEDEARLAALDLPRRFVYYPASLWAHKNHEGLLDAFGRIADDELVLLLSGATFGRLEELLAGAARRGLGDRVRHLGFVEDATLPAVYRAATALVFPSRYEGFGVPPLEAMACGCPVASSRLGSLAEVCGDAVEPLDPGDPGQMATAIGRLLGDRDRRDRLRAKGFEQVRRFTWARSAEQLLAGYDRAGEMGPITSHGRRRK